MTKPLSISLINANHIQLNAKNENLSFITASKSFGNNFNASLGFGADVNSSFGENASTNVRPALEAKIKYNFDNNTNAQLRYRRRGNTDQYRVTFGGNHKLDKHQSIYASAHVTANKGETFSANAGGWVGYTYKFDNGISISAEAQANCPIKKDLSVGKELQNGGNYLFNVITSIPLN